MTSVVIFMKRIYEKKRERSEILKLIHDPQKRIPHDTKRNFDKISSFIKENPGCTQQFIAISLKLSTNNVCYHLRKLSKQDRIELVHSGKYVKVYDRDHNKMPNCHLSPNLELVLNVLRTDQGMTQKEIMDSLDIPQSTLSRTIASLINKGLINIVRKGNRSAFIRK
jgi:uncharacterized membrane protein